MNIEKTSADIRTLCEQTSLDIQNGYGLLIDYYRSELRRIVGDLKHQLPDLFGDFGDVPEEHWPTAMRLGLTSNNKEAAIFNLREINAMAEKLYKRLPKETDKYHTENDSLVTLERIFSHFHQVTSQLRNRHNSRSTIDVNDEYDVQDLLHALLRLYFDDIRPEEWTPSYAGGSAKMDFLLKVEQVVIEVKRTRDDLRDKKIGDQLLIDVGRYKGYPDCKVLVCFIYDPEGKVGNPVGLENDLAKCSTDYLSVKAFVFPK